MTQKAARHPSDSAVQTTQLVLPPDTNTHGTAFGGRIMQWMDIAAGIAAGRHCGGPVVTAAVDELVFAAPVRMADVVLLLASVNFAGHTSMEVGVRVESENPITGMRQHCLTGYFTFVAVDPDGAPREVPPLVAQTELEQSRMQAAIQRRERRLQRREQR